ncbi:cytochrome c oxidase accessory protein CcoG [Ideonella sp. DXS29W]|uniref:Cytochrome c oxidase accessory protein CcoG n=2 Tax=Ideonella lacteola TaxID=2984193 RepID=A0ABU9BWJ2_9BURK
MGPQGGADVGDVSSGETVSLYQKQRKIYPRSVTGTFATWRWMLVWATQLVFYGMPWLMWNDRQAVLLDLASRRFYIFGLVLYPQDFIYLTGLLILSAYALFLFTAVAGRLWCGYACPQTVYTEIFMWVERKFEGDRAQRMKLDEGPWDWNRIWRKAGKQGLWITIGLWTGFTFVGYFTPIRHLAEEAMTLGFGPWEWFWVLFYGFATYGNAGYMREQVCKYMCPYARFQSAMFDRDTLIISYDPERGEPRGSRSRKADPKQLGLGSCIDCGLCVQVCPTGIDIRKGLQYECIGCAACVDVCDGIMDKMAYPRGLIRYATENSMSEHLGWRQIIARIIRPRVLIYTAVMLLIAGAFVGSLAVRSPFRVDVVRDRAALARLVDDGYIENVYRLQVMNVTEAPQSYRVTVEGLPGVAIERGAALSLQGAEARWLTVAVRVPPEAANQAGTGAHPIVFHIERLAAGNANSARVSERSSFVVPR